MPSSNRLSYPQRLFLWLLGYSALLVGCFVIFQYQREKEFKAEELNTRLQLINNYILTELREGNDIRDISLKEFHPFDDIRVSIIAGTGEVVYDNSLDSLPRTNHLEREEIRHALRYGQGYTVRRHSESTGDNYFYSATKGDDGVTVRTAVPYSISLRALLKADYNFIRVMGSIALVMCLLGYFATRRVGDHISRLSKFAENVEKGVRISDTEPFPNDELGSISNHIVRLYGRLQQAIADRDSEHRAAMREQAEKEKVKKRLTNNINHELKTPVASIKVCVETLLAHKDLTPEKRESFLVRCLQNADRLQRLLRDVSLVTRMDSGRDAVLKEPVDLAGIIEEVVADRVLVAQEKNISIINTVGGPLPIVGNGALLEAVFNNLIDNAIAYSGGSRVEISADYVDGESVRLTVCDDGVGVPEEHLPRLFERFYRIDKGRSRAAGGTGLGLSIVKNAVMMHDGKITVENCETGGLLFRIAIGRGIS